MIEQQQKAESCVTHKEGSGPSLIKCPFFGLGETLDWENKIRCCLECDDIRNCKPKYFGHKQQWHWSYLAKLKKHSEGFNPLKAYGYTLTAKQHGLPAGKIRDFFRSIS